jgi:hypothetical protein
MNIHPDDGRLFYNLYSALMFFGNQRIQVLEEPVADVAAYEGLPPQSRMKVRDAFYAQPNLIDQFVQENPANLAREQANGSWVYSVTRKPRTVQSFSTPHAVRMRDTLSGWFCFMQASLSG